MGLLLSNVQILWISVILFTSFVIAEIIAAYVSNSLALLGDAAAMSVDVFTVSTSVSRPVLAVLRNDALKCIVLLQSNCGNFKSIRKGTIS